MAGSESTVQRASSLATTLRDSFKYGSSLRDTMPQGQVQNTYLLGYPIAHSLAPLLHSTLFKAAGLPWTYSLLESKEMDDLLSLLPSPSTIGSAVTMPHKVTFTTKVDEITAEGRAIGAINTVFIRMLDGKRRYIGTNTDCIGVREAFLSKLDPEALSISKTRPALVIGGGGACRSALYALHQWFDIKTIYVINRFKHEIDGIVSDFSKVPGWTARIVHVQSVAEAEQLEMPYLVVGTVPDYPPSTPEEKMCQEAIRAIMSKPSTSRKGVVLEMCYHPNIRTSFYEFAESNGWEVLPGTDSMIWQGVAQQILWTEDMAVADDAVVKKGAETILDVIKSHQTKQQ